MLPDIVVLRLTRKEATILSERLDSAASRRDRVNHVDNRGALTITAIDLMPVAAKLREAMKPSKPSDLELEADGQETLPLPAA